MIRMTPAGTLLGIIGAALAIVTLIALAAHQWDRLWAWLPWSAETRLERVIRDRDHWAASAAVHAAEAEALRGQIVRTEAAQRSVTTLRDLTTPFVDEARSAPDASTHLDPERADRLREHDRRLCELAPGGCIAGSDRANADAGTGDAAMSGGGAAR